MVGIIGPPAFGKLAMDPEVVPPEVPFSSSISLILIAVSPWPSLALDKHV